MAAKYVARNLPGKEIVALDLMARAALVMRDQPAAKAAIDRALELGAVEDLLMDLALRHTALLVRSLSGNKEEIVVELDALQAEATRYGYLLRANKIAKSRESL